MISRGRSPTAESMALEIALASRKEESRPMKSKPLGITAGFWLLAACLAGPALNVQAAPPDLRLPPLTAAEPSPQLPGKFVWADLVTDNVEAARKFYGAMFGWTFQAVDHYTIASHDEQPLCGLIQRPRPAGSSARPRWFGYLSVSSVAQAERAVTAGGGRVLAPPQQFPERGEQAVFADPEGALFGVIKSSSGDPEDFLADVGDWIWIQLLSRDARRAAEFYRAVGGYDIVENTAGNQLSDYTLVSEGYARATVRTIPAEHKQVQPAWLLFVRVKNVGESLGLTKQLGGKVLLEPKPELFDGRVAVIADPTGAAIGILEWGEKALKGAQ
jgi:predicted enzyme related to lactoylglutathione lyase